jgi:hypothetical protein
MRTVVVYPQALARIQANNATQVAPNNRGTASANGRERDSPSLRPGPANAASVRPYSGTARLISAMAVSGTNTPRAGSLAYKMAKTPSSPTWIAEK